MKEDHTNRYILEACVLECDTAAWKWLYKQYHDTHGVYSSQTKIIW